MSSKVNQKITRKQQVYGEKQHCLRLSCSSQGPGRAAHTRPWRSTGAGMTQLWESSCKALS